MLFDKAGALNELVEPILETDVIFLLHEAIRNHKNDDDELRRVAASALKRLYPAFLAGLKT
jgi:hypothetical protein